MDYVVLHLCVFLYFWSGVSLTPVGTAYSNGPNIPALMISE